MNLDDFPKPDVTGVFEEKRRMYRILYCLQDMGYNIDSAREIVDVIKRDKLDISQFVFPYGSFDAFEAHTLAGEFDFDESEYIATPEQIAAYEQETKDKHLWERS